MHFILKLCALYFIIYFYSSACRPSDGFCRLKCREGVFYCWGAWPTLCSFLLLELEMW